MGELTEEKGLLGIDISSSMITLAKKQQAEQRKESADFMIADIERLVKSSFLQKQKGRSQQWQNA
jgi:ubiquinone/menaquinone biosynthesis C-methylase UbiE